MMLTYTTQVANYSSQYLFWVVWVTVNVLWHIPHFSSPCIECFITFTYWACMMIGEEQDGDSSHTSPKYEARNILYNGMENGVVYNHRLFIQE